MPPLPWLDSVSWEPNSSSAFDRGIVMTFRQGGQLDDLGYASGVGRDILCYPPEVLESLVDPFPNINYDLALGRDFILEANEHVM